MQIRTVLAIGAGLAIGIATGVCVSEDTKCMIFGKVRKKLIYALGGEEKKNYTTYSGVHKRYADYSVKKDYKEQKDDVPEQVYRKFLEFDDYDSAERFLEEIKKHIEKYGMLTVWDLRDMCEAAIDYKWDCYGWKREDLEQIGKPINCINHKYVLDLPKPKLIGYWGEQIKE